MFNLKVLTIITIVLSGAGCAHGDQTEVVTSSTHQIDTTLPRCVDDRSTIDNISSTVNTNRRNSFKYDGYRQALQTDSDTELLARLAYSETLAANCSDQQSAMAPLITQTIARRVHLRKGDVRSVVFQRDQFASSLNIYAESRYQDFLCPKDARLWATTLNAARANLEKPVGNLDASTVNYFLYKHSPKWTKEPWKLNEDTSATNPQIQQCVRFFKVPGWK